MRSTRAQTKADRKTEHNLTSPIHRLPDELLVHIFVLGCPKPDLDIEHSRDRDVEDPLPYQVLVSSICRLWRRISLQTPALWSFIFIKLPFRDLRMGKRYESLMNAIAKRTGKAAVVLTLKPRQPQCFTINAHYGSESLKTCLTSLLSRTRFLKYHGWRPIAGLPVFPITRARYPHLQDLSIKFLGESFPSIIAEPLNLRTFASMDYTSVYELSYLVNANPQQVFLTLRDMNNEKLARVSSLARLEELDIQTERWTASQPYSSTTLKELTLLVRQPSTRDHRTYALPPLGDHPALLHLSTCTYNSRWFVSEFRLDLIVPAPPLPTLHALKTLAIQERSRHALREIDGQLPYEVIRELLVRMPNLQALELWNVNAFEALDYLRDGDKDGSSDSSSLRNLRLLRIVMHDGWTEDLSPVARGCSRLMDERPNLQVDWWIMSHPEDKGKLWAQRLLEQAPEKVRRYICKFPEIAPPSLRTVFDLAT